MPTESDGTTAAAAGSPAPSGRQAGTTRYNSPGRGAHGRCDRQNNSPGPKSNRRNPTRFEGREPLLKGLFYDSTGEWTPDQFIKTNKEIVNYVGRTYTKYTPEITQAVWDLELADPMPPAVPDLVNVIAFEMWKLELKEHRVKEREYSNFRAGLYNVVFGQCTEALQDKLKPHINFPNAYQDGIVLLTIIKTITYTFEERRNLVDVLCDIKEMFYTFK
jgi:hypothetical protein